MWAETARWYGPFYCNDSWITLKIIVHTFSGEFMGRITKRQLQISQEKWKSDKHEKIIQIDKHGLYDAAGVSREMRRILTKQVS